MSIANAFQVGLQFGRGIGRQIDDYQANKELEEEELAGVAMEQANEDYTNQVQQYQTAAKEGFISQTEADKLISNLKTQMPATTYRKGYTEGERKDRKAELFENQLRSSGDSEFADQFRDRYNQNKTQTERRNYLKQQREFEAERNPYLLEQARQSSELAGLNLDLARDTYDARVEAPTLANNLTTQQIATSNSRQLTSDQQRQQASQLFPLQMQGAATELASKQASLNSQNEQAVRDQKIDAGADLFSAANSADGDVARGAITQIIKEGGGLFNAVGGTQIEWVDGQPMMMDKNGNPTTNAVDYIMNLPPRDRSIALNEAQMFYNASIDPAKYGRDLYTAQYYRNRGLNTGGKGGDAQKNLQDFRGELRQSIEDYDQQLIDNQGNDEAVAALTTQRNRAYENLQAVDTLLNKGFNISFTDDGMPDLNDDGESTQEEQSLVAQLMQEQEQEQQVTTPQRLVRQPQQTGLNTASLRQQLDNQPAPAPTPYGQVGLDQQISDEDLQRIIYDLYRND